MSISDTAVGADSNAAAPPLGDRADSAPPGTVFDIVVADGSLFPVLRLATK